MNPATTVAVPNTDLTAAMRLRGRVVWVVSPLTRNELDIYWTPQPVTGKTLNGVNIYRHITARFQPTDPGVVKLNTSLVTVPFYRDLTVDMTRQQRFYYLVMQHFTDNTQLPIDYPTNLDIAENNTAARQKNISFQRIYKEWRRRKGIIMRGTAENTQLLVQRTSGPRCECFNPKYEQATYGTCPTCYGVGFDRGYELLNDVPCRILGHQEVLKLQPAGLQFSANPKAWLIDFPILRNGDVFCRQNGLRYEVNSLDLILHQGILTEQNFELVELPTTHPVYAFVLTPPS